MFHLKLLLTSLAVLQVDLAAAQDVVHVWPNCSNTAAQIEAEHNGTECTEMDQALRQLLVSGTTLMLHAGEYVLRQSTVVSHVHNVSIVGEDESDVVLTCEPGHGLAFVNVSGLQITGLTIQSCGLSGANLETAVRLLEELVTNFISVPPIIKIALFIGQCEQVTMERVTVTNTSGIGLLGVNVIGQSRLQEVTFKHNTRPSCIGEDPTYPFDFDDVRVHKQIGGGAYLLYLDPHGKLPSDNSEYQLDMVDCVFRFNSECSYTAFTHISFQYYFEYFPINQTDFFVGAGGGLSILMAQLGYSVIVNVDTSSFEHNDARFGGGAYIAFFLGVQESGVRFTDCNFTENGLRSQPVSFSNGGAGMAIFTDILRPSDLLHVPNLMTSNIFVDLNNTHFVDNSASIQGGGLLTYSQYKTQTIPAVSSASNLYVKFAITDCVFRGNSAVFGSAAFLNQRIHQGIDGGVGVWLKNVQFIQNQELRSAAESHLHHDRHIGPQSSNSESSTLDMRGIQVYCSGSNEISDNEVTGCNIQSSVVHILTNTSFTLRGNQGHFGGGVRLKGTSPSIVLGRNTRLRLLDNNATKAGGGIYFSSSTSASTLLQAMNNSDCFLYPSLDQCPTTTSCTTLIDQSNIVIEFAGNRAPLGSSIYGSTLESCIWANRLLELRDMYAPNTPFLKFIKDQFDSILIFNDFDEAPSNAALLSTPPLEINVNSSLAWLYPGEKIILDAVIRDSFGYRIPSVLTSHISSNSINATSTLGASGFWFADLNRTRTPITITGAENQTVDVTFLTFDASASTELSFELRSCPLGFSYNQDNNSCECDRNLLTQTEVRCNMDNFKLIVPRDTWIGPASFTDANISNADLVVHRCVRQYCTGEMEFEPPDFNAQCVDEYNRDGVLCGGCNDNFSIAFGSQVRCIRCENYFLFQIGTAVVFGIVLFVTIALLGITIDKGWLNMVLFYCNGVYVFISFRTSYPFLQYFSIPLAALSLQVEVDSCFYDGMTSLAAAGLSFITPLYLLVLMAIFALVSRRSTRLSNRFSPVSTFVTLAILSYVSILENCVEILGVTTLKTLGNDTLYRWARDPNQVYFRGWHAVLGVIAILFLLLYIIPLPLVLLVPKIAYRYFKRIIPFLDALYAPFEPKYRFWLGLRLIARGIIFILPNFSSPLTSFSIVGLILVCLVHIQLTIKPFKNRWQNILDSGLIADMIALAIGSLYFNSTGLIDPESQKSLIIINLGYLVLVGGAYIVFVFILIVHVMLKYPSLEKPWMKIKERLRRKSMVSVTSQVSILSNNNSLSLPTEVRSSGDTNNEYEMPSTNSEGEFFSADYVSQSVASSVRDKRVTRSELYRNRRPVDFTVYRESVVEDFELESV